LGDLASVQALEVAGAVSVMPASANDVVLVGDGQSWPFLLKMERLRRAMLLALDLHGCSVAILILSLL